MGTYENIYWWNKLSIWRLWSCQTDDEQNPFFLERDHFMEIEYWQWALTITILNQFNQINNHPIPFLLKIHFIYSNVFPLNFFLQTLKPKILWVFLIISAVSVSLIWSSHYFWSKYYPSTPFVKYPNPVIFHKYEAPSLTPIHSKRAKLCLWRIVKIQIILHEVSLYIIRKFTMDSWSWKTDLTWINLS